MSSGKLLVFISVLCGLLTITSNAGSPDLVVGATAKTKNTVSIAAKHVDQKLSNDVGLDTQGKSVNLDLWEYSLVLSDEHGILWTYCLNDNYDSFDSGYKGEFINGAIQGNIPATINNVPVTSLRYTFGDIKSLVVPPKIPDTVVYMYGTFYGNSSLTTVPSFPENLQILDYCFTENTSLDNLKELPDSLISMQYAFAGCKSITKPVNIPSNIQRIDGLFMNCQNLTETAKVPTGVISMRATYAGCKRLSQVDTLPESVIDVSELYYNCDSLTKVPDYPESVRFMLGTHANNFNLLGAVNIPASVRDISYLFDNCTKLTGNIIISGIPRYYNNFLRGVSIKDNSINIIGDSKTTEAIQKID